MEEIGGWANYEAGAYTTISTSGAVKHIENAWLILVMYCSSKDVYLGRQIILKQALTIPDSLQYKLEGTTCYAVF